MKYFLIFLALAFAFVNCKPKSQVNTPEGSSDTTALAVEASENGIEEKYWKLTEIMGKPAPPTPPDGKEVHIKFRKAENRLQGFGGCNGLGGNYELEAGDRIKISNILRTQMACPELDTENELIKVLETADNYNINGDTLVLNRARMAPLVRFQAVYFD
jgi:heat shock protein HslJ